MIGEKVQMSKEVFLSAEPPPASSMPFHINANGLPDPGFPLARRNKNQIRRKLSARIPFGPDVSANVSAMIGELACRCLWPCLRD